MLKFQFIVVLISAVFCNHAFGLDLSSFVPHAVYFWQQGGEGDWQAPSSWAPARSSPEPSDILVFNTGGVTTATNIPTESIGRLVVSGNTTVNLQSTAAIVLTVGGGDGDDLVVSAGSALNFSGANAISCSLQTGATAKMDGMMTFSSPNSAAHRLTAVDIGSIHFESGAVFSATNGFVGNPFGTTNLNSVIFESGSACISGAGADPFGAEEPNSVVAFSEGSLFSLRGDAIPSFSGRTYANFEMNSPGRSVWATGASPLVMDNLTLLAGRLYLNLSGDPGHSIRGDIILTSGTRLIFSSGTVRLNGTEPQTFIGASAAQQVDAGSTIAIDNPTGINLNYWFVAWNLELRNGLVNTGSWDVSVAGNVLRTNGYVNGRQRRYFFSPGSYTFDVGTETAYSPVHADVTAAVLSALSVRASQTAQPNILDPSKALGRYWQISEEGQGGLITDLTFYYRDADVPPTANESNFVIERYSNGVFTQPAGIIDTFGNTFRMGITDFFSENDFTLAEPGALIAPDGSAFDFDGDGLADVSVFRPTTGAWYLFESIRGFIGVSFGVSTDKITPADFDGDGKTDVAVYRPAEGTWYWLNSSTGAMSAVQFGSGEDLPTAADYDGDGRADTSVFRPSNGVWYRLNSADGSFSAVQFGVSEDKPTIGDFDGDGRADVAVFRPSTGVWYRLSSSDGQFVGVSFGLPDDLITPADFDGDGKTDLAVYRASTGTWYSLDSATGALRATQFGAADDQPTAADFDGDGRADVSVFRPSSGVWYRLNSGNGSFFAVQFGAEGDRPTPAAFRY